MRKWILFFLMLTGSVSMHAQKKITGRVMDGAMAGEPLIGATVQVPGTNIGTITDLEGNFSFELPAGKNLIQISMMGYKTQVINVKGKVTVTVTLAES